MKPNHIKTVGVLVFSEIGDIPNPVPGTYSEHARRNFIIEVDRQILGYVNYHVTVNEYVFTPTDKRTVILTHSGMQAIMDFIVEVSAMENLAPVV